MEDDEICTQQELENVMNLKLVEKVKCQLIVWLTEC